MSSGNQIKNILLLMICLTIVLSHQKSDQLSELSLSSDRGLID